VKVELRGYQSEAFDKVRGAIRAGAKRVLVSAPTGSGKTVLASALMELTVGKGNKANFVVDRLSLIGQTSETFDRYGLPHGVIQSDHPRYRPSEPIQVCSIQTLSKRGWPDAQVDVFDECHVLHAAHKARMKATQGIVVGLTATPFTRGLGKYFDAIVNVTTTRELIVAKWLSPYQVFSCVEPDMSSVRVNSMGEWDESESSGEALKVVGDVVAEYIKHGESRKFICSGVDTVHVQELQRQFLAAGINVASYTYLDKDEDRADTTAEFRKPNSSIRGLVTITAASRGFDVPDVRCIIMARPLRKSLAEHIQLLGRGLRISDGKENCRVLCHSGNMARFWQDTEQFFDEGVARLDDGKPKDKKKPEKKEPAPMKCPGCGHLHRPMPFCPSCGFEYPKRASVQHEAGTLKEIVASGDRNLMRKEIWPQVCWHVAHKKSPRDDAHAQRMAQAIYAEMTGGVAMARFENTRATECTPEVAARIRANQQRWIMANRAAARKTRPVPEGWGETRGVAT
jgi:superfamily II DNA or RNA helicase